MSAPPFLDRTVLHRRLPKRTVREEIPPKDFRRPFVTTTVLKLSNADVIKLKKLAGGGADGKRVSTFVAVASHVWRCACRARGISSGVETRMYFPMNFRRRLSPPLPLDSFGHAIFYTSVSAKVDQRFIDSVEIAAKRIQETLAEIRVEEEEEERVKPRWKMEKNEIWVTSWLSLPLHELDYGYGKPTFTVVGRRNSPGTFYLLRGSTGGVNVAASLEPETMPLLVKLMYEDFEGGNNSNGGNKLHSKL